MADSRSDAREHALSLLYEAESKRCSIEAVIDAQVVPCDEATEVVARGVGRDQGSLDALIGRFSTGWSVERMPSIDRIVLRIASFELLHRSDVPTAVILNEAVELAKRFSTEDSGRFVNGVLAAIAREVRADR